MHALSGTTSDFGALSQPRSPRFGEESVSALGQALRHSHSAQTAAIEMLRAIPMPSIFTDGAGRCIERNPAFGHAMEALDLRLAVGRVRFANPHQQDAWEAAVAQTHSTAVGQTLSLTARSGKPWRAHLTPLHSVMDAGAATHSKLILTVFDNRPAEAPATPDAMAGSSRLTRAELEVLAGLLQGLPAKMIATRRGASVNTVRSQIMAILDKTGHKSQRALIASFGASAFGASSIGE